MKICFAMLFGCLGALSGGCLSGGPVPADKLARSQAAVRSAQEIGAERSVEGARHLMAAKTALAEGKKLVIDGDQERATSLLLRAEADAELAMNLTREATAIADAAKTRAEIQALKVSMTTKDGE